MAKIPSTRRASRGHCPRAVAPLLSKRVGSTGFIPLPRGFQPLRVSLGALVFVLASGASARAEPIGPLARLAPSAVASPSISARILRFANVWHGTPYRWGGTSRSGIDCSAYLRQMFRNLFAVELPRTTKQQIYLGKNLPIDRRELSKGLVPGDLIFYVDRAGVPNHVVVYAGNGRITHSESGRGVVVDPIRKLHGRRVVGRRVLLPLGKGSPERGGDPSFGPIPAAGPIVSTEIPCPDSYRPSRGDVSRYRRKTIPEPAAFEQKELCHLRLLAEALAAKPEAVAKANAARLESYAEWRERVEGVESLFDGP